MNRYLLAAACVLQFAAAFAGTDVEVRDAWIRAAPPNVPVLAGYFTLQNRSERHKALLGGKSPAFGRMTLHRSEMSGGTAQMHALTRLELPPHAMLDFQPGGHHVMLEDPKRPLHPGDKVPFELNFDDGSKLEATFTVRDARAAHGGH